MTLSRQSLEILLDLIEIKANSLHVHGRDDARELNKLRKCKQELVLELNQFTAKRTKKSLGFSESSKNLHEKPSYLRAESVF